MGSLFSIELPIGPSDLLAIERIVLDAGLLFPGNYLGEYPPRAVEYQRATFVDEVEFLALFDRNLISRVAQLAAGKVVPGDATGQASRVAAAALCFCAVSGIVIEPNIALYELADTQGHDVAAAETRLFRIADNCDPRALADVATGAANRLLVRDSIVARVDQRYSAEPLCEPNFARTLAKWKLHYLYVLKVADLRRANNSPIQAASAMLRWQYEETFLNSVASSYCLNAISHRPPKGRMLKDFRSVDPSKLCRGIRNATWDIFLLSEFKKRLKRTDNKLWSLWTADVALRAVASNEFVRDSSDASAKLLADLVARWGERDGALLADEYSRYNNLAQRDTDERKEHLDIAFAHLNDMIRILEAKLDIPMQKRLNIPSE